MRYLGIDYGDKKIGLAFGDDQVHVAVPLDVIQNMGEETLRDLALKVKAEAIDWIVVGVPLSTVEGPGSEQLEKTRQFILDLQKVIPTIPVAEEDERYSTAESIRLQREQGATAEEDAIAAMLILQAYLDQQGVEGRG
ncbi:Holliday junction resolvase RuvX [Patescibacteria group bacterium]|nr:Holliday junction resolvase RuvX [Patescibacteria group bacterium]MBU1907485.1 Holliday junction resolvase RuvX [Patescibacteria group bacterium]